MHFPGGKGGLYRQLIGLMPPHEVYIETHLGSGAVLRFKKEAARNIGIDLDPDVIRTWQGRATRNLEIRQADAVDFLRAFPFAGAELIYCDPPYLPETRRRQRIYRFEYSEQDHEELLTTLKELPAMVMISGYDSELYRDLLSGWRCVRFQTGSHGQPRIETVWINFDPPAVPHDLRYFGRDFREREQVRRRQQRLKRRLESLEPAERALLFEWMQERFATELEAQ